MPGEGTGRTLNDWVQVEGTQWVMTAGHQLTQGSQLGKAWERRIIPRGVFQMSVGKGTEKLCPASPGGYGTDLTEVGKLWFLHSASDAFLPKSLPAFFIPFSPLFTCWFSPELFFLPTCLKPVLGQWQILTTRGWPGWPAGGCKGQLVSVKKSNSYVMQSQAEFSEWAS